MAPWLLVCGFLLMTLPRVMVHVAAKVLRHIGFVASSATAEVMEQVVEEVFDMPRTLMEQPPTAATVDGRWLFLGFGYLLRQVTSS